MQKVPQIKDFTLSNKWKNFKKKNLTDPKIAEMLSYIETLEMQIMMLRNDNKVLERQIEALELIVNTFLKETEDDAK